jgi:serine/threonine-protein kinase
MATVYRAWDERLKRDVAVKVIAEHLIRDPVSVRRFRAEAELAAHLVHPNVVAVLDAGVVPRDFIVMEFVDGVDAGTLQRRARLTPGQAVHVVAQVCDALGYVHGQGVVHHDVAPRNILIRRPDGTAKLADFGLASAAARGVASGVRDVMGTPGYVAPEILGGARPSPRSDLYSVGVVAYRLLAAPSGMRARDPKATVPQVTAAPRMPPLAEVCPELPGHLTEAVDQAMARDPGARQASVGQFCAQLVESAPPRLELAGAA